MKAVRINGRVYRVRHNGRLYNSLLTSKIGKRLETAVKAAARRKYNATALSIDIDPNDEVYVKFVGIDRDSAKTLHSGSLAYMDYEGHMIFPSSGDTNDAGLRRFARALVDKVEPT